jgi:hypothetical protein
MASNSKKMRRAQSPDQSKQPPPKNKGGRPPYVATPKLRALVIAMAEHGIPHSEIAQAIDPPCSEPTLRKVFEKELAVARPRYKGKIGRAISMWLLGRPAEWTEAVLNKARTKVLVEPKLVQKEIPPDIAMAIFQAKVVLGQTERSKVDHTILNVNELVRSLTGLSDRERTEFERLAAKAVAAEGNDPSAIMPAGGEDDDRTTRH